MLGPYVQSKCGDVQHTHRDGGETLQGISNQTTYICVSVFYCSLYRLKHREEWIKDELLVLVDHVIKRTPEQKGGIWESKLFRSLNIAYM